MLSLLPLASAHAAAPRAPAGLMAEFQPAATRGTVFVGTRLPRFSWQLSGSGLEQLGYQLQVLEPDQGGATIWDSGHVKSNESSLVEYDSLATPLQSDTTYTWRVRWWSDDAGPSAWTTASFRTALLDDAEWEGAEYIHCASTPRCLYLRSELTLPANETVKHASAFVSGMGWVEAYLDGVKLGDDAVLEPGWSQWDARILYSSHDITDLIAASGRKTAVGLVLGNGWPGKVSAARSELAACG